MKVIFLDVDGVLNANDYIKTTDKVNDILRIHDSNLINLQKLKISTDAEIILTSTWKFDYAKKNDLGKYLIDKLEEYNLQIYDYTIDNFYDRGRGIIEYLNKHPYIEEFVILDDDYFNDYDIFGLTSNLIRTSCAKGLTESDIEKAIKILNTK